jgi:hypothetical protein
MGNRRVRREAWTRLSEKLPQERLRDRYGLSWKYGDPKFAELSAMRFSQ